MRRVKSLFHWHVISFLQSGDNNNMKTLLPIEICLMKNAEWGKKEDQLFCDKWLGICDRKQEQK